MSYLKLARSSIKNCIVGVAVWTGAAATAKCGDLLGGERISKFPIKTYNGCICVL